MSSSKKGYMFSTVDSRDTGGWGPFGYPSSLVQQRYAAEIAERKRQASVLQDWMNAAAIGQTPERPWDAKSVRAARRLAKKMRPVAHHKINGDVEYKIGGQHVETRDSRGRVVDSMLVGRSPAAIATAFGIPLVQALDVTATPPRQPEPEAKPAEAAKPKPDTDEEKKKQSAVRAGRARRSRAVFDGWKGACK